MAGRAGDPRRIGGIESYIDEREREVAEREAAWKAELSRREATRWCPTSRRRGDAGLQPGSCRRTVRGCAEADGRRWNYGTVRPVAALKSVPLEATEMSSPVVTPTRGGGGGGRGNGNGGAEEEEHHHNPFLGHPSNYPKLQHRKEVSRARWDEGMGMGEVTEKKGSMWATTGVVRDGKLYCQIEEILFLAERGALLLSGLEDATVSIKDIYKKIAEGKYGCCWESFEAYRHLKKLGYIVGRHGIPWTMKSSNTSSFGLSSVQRTSESDGKPDGDLGGSTSIINQFNDMQIDEIKPTFDVHLPDSKFRKSSPGNPSFILSLCGDYPPTRTQVENVEKKCHGIPLKFCFVDHGRVCFFTFDKIELPTLA